MSKVNILRLDSVTANDTTATATINTNFQNIQSVIDTLLSRTGDTPNYMTAVLDMNSQRIINTAAPEGDLDVVNKAYLDGFVGDIEAKVAEANEAADAALEKAANAASSATYAAVSAQGAQNSAKDAEAAAAEAAADAAASAQAATDIEGDLTDPNLVAVGTDLRKGNDSLIKQVSEMDEAAIIQAGEDAVQAAEDAEDYKDAAEAAAQSVADTDFAVDLSYTNSTLQLIDQNGDALGTSITLKTLPSQTGQSGKFLTTNGSAASWTTVAVLPAQSGNNGKFLTTNGSTASWASIPDMSTYKGQYDSSVTYNRGDYIFYVDSRYWYICRNDNTTGIAPNDEMYWTQIYDDHLVNFRERSDNSSYHIGLVPGETSGSNYNGAVRFSLNAPKINASTGDIIGYQKTSNLVTSVSSSSTDTQYPSAKLFYDTCGDIESLINAL